MSIPMDEAKVLKTIEGQIGIHPNFPKQGILFRDVMPIFRSPTIFMDMIKLLSSKVEHFKPDIVLGIEARGFLIGPSIAYELKKPFVPIRKKGKLPGDLVSVKYDLEYGQDEIEIQKKSVPSGSRCLVVDDLIATGGTMAASKKLIELSGSEVIAFAAIVELKDLKGSEKLGDASLVKLFSY